MLSLTETAAEKAKKIIEEEGKPGTTYLRVAILGGGCSGFNYDLSLDDDPIGDQDEVFEHFGVKVVTNSICLTYIDGTEIDYESGLYAAGFKFNNPNAKTTCGCAQSFSV